MPQIDVSHAMIRTNGFVRFSSPMVVTSPWPGKTTVSSGNEKRFVSDHAINCW